MNEPFSWKKFRIGDLFEQERGKEKAPSQAKPGNYPLVNEHSSNNGIQSYCTPTKVFKGNCITVSINYATTVFYQSSDFGASVNIAILRNPNFNRRSYLYVVTLLKKLHARYTYSFKISKDKLNDEIICLPVTISGEIDFDYMEKYIDKLEKNFIPNIELYLKISGLDNYEINESDKKIIELAQSENLNYSKFKVGDIFEFENTGNTLVNSVKYDRNGINFITASSVNNGNVGKIKCCENDKIMKGNCIFIGGKTFSISYQGEDFVSNDSHNFTLRYKSVKIGKPQYLYMVSLISKLSQLYTWNDAVTSEKISDKEIVLPVSDDGKPDFDFMETYIRVIEKKVVSRLYEENAI